MRHHPTRTLLHLALATPLLLAAACSDDDGAPTAAAASLEQLNAACTSYCERGNECFQHGDDCATRCAAVKDPQYFRADFVTEVTQCINALDCSGSEDGCFGDAIQTLRSDYASNPDFTACMAARASCASSETPLSDDHCFNQLMLTDAGIADYAACWELTACAEISACAHEVATALNEAAVW